MTEILALLLEHGLTILFGVLAIAGRAVIAHGAEYLKLKADSEVRAYLTAGLDRALEYGKAEARRRLQDVTREVAAERQPNLQVELARGYVQDRFADALKRFDVDTAGLDKMLRARIPAQPRPIGG